ncbi:MAG: hypothetical protein ACLS95_07260 [Clostridia bacterium]|jgi:hypothetical protein
MGKKCKKKKLTQNPISNPKRDFEVRLVDKSDTWCYFKSYLNSDYDFNAPYGYIVDIPYIPKNTLSLADFIPGIIIRTKKQKGHFLLQVVKLGNSDLSYGICSYMRSISHHRKRRIIHVSRFNS